MNCWHRDAWPVQEGADGIGVSFNGAVPAAEPFAQGVNFVARSFQSAGGVHEGGLEVGRRGDIGEFALNADVGSSAVGFDDRDTFGDASSVCGELLVFGGDVFAWAGALLGNSGGPVGVCIADRVEDAIVLATMAL